MSSYIGKVQITGGNSMLVGSTMYGICNTDAEVLAKTVITTDDNSGNFINNNYDTPLQGVTIHIKFKKGNTATNNLTLQIGSSNDIYNIIGNCTCPPGTIISFTLDETNKWIVNDNVNTEYEFKTPYNAITNKVLTQLDIGEAAPKGVVQDIATDINSTDLPTAAAVASYVQSLTSGIAGVTKTMHFRGIATSEPSGSEKPNGISDYNGNNTMVSGDIVIYQSREYIWNGTSWQLLGDEEKYTSDNIGSASGWDAGSASNAVVSNGVLQLTNSTIPSLSITATNVIVPNNN